MTKAHWLHVLDELLETDLYHYDSHDDALDALSPAARAIAADRRTSIESGQFVELCVGGQALRVASDGTISYWDHIAGHYTVHGRMSPQRRELALHRAGCPCGHGRG
jgi:hypothetical protein